MKKFDVLKVLAITFLVFVILSWIIPAGLYSSGVYQKAGSTIPIGLYDFIRIPTITLATFIQYGLVFLAIGGFYGVLNKTGIYANCVNAIAKKWDKHKTAFLVVTTVLFALLSAVTALPTLLFVLVPFFVAILMKLGYKKMPVFAATVGALLVGQIGGIIGFNLWGYLQFYFSLKTTTMLLARIVLFLMITILFVLLILKGVKSPSKTKGKKESKEEDVIPLYEENTSKKSAVPFIIIAIAMLVVLVLGMYDWYHAFEIEAFSQLHESIMSYEISGYPIFANLLGSVNELGFWGNYDLVVILVLASLLIGWIYSVKMRDILTSFADGAKKMLPAAFYAMLASIIFACILSMTNSSGQSTNFVITVIDKILSASDKFSLLGTVGSSLITSFVYNDFSTLVSTFYPTFSAINADMLSITAILIQSIYGLVMLLAPTSVFLLAGLKYMDIPYKEWMKYIWKFALIVFGIIVVVGFILTTLV